MKINAFAVSGLAGCILTLFFSCFSYFKNRNNKAAKLWAIFNISAAIWGLGVWKIATTVDKTTAFFWWRFAHIGVIFMPVFFFQFVYAFVELKKKNLLIIIYLAGFVFLIANFTNLFIANMRFVFSSFYYDSPPGFIYPFFVLFFAAVIGYSHYALFKTLRMSHGLKRNQIKYFLLATMVGFSGGATCFLPCFGINLYPWGNFAISLYPPLMAYAVVRYRLLDINFVITKTVAYSILLSTSTLMYVALTVGADKLFAGSLWYDSMLAHTAVFLLMAMGFIYYVPYIKAMTEKVVEKALFKNKFLYRDELRNFGRKISFGITQKELLSNTVNFIAKGMQSPYVLIVLRNESYDNYMPEMWAGFSDEEIKALQFEENNAMIKWLAENKEVLIREEIALIEDARIRKDIENELKRIKAYLCIPLCVSANFIGFLSLSERSNAEMYSHIDIGLLQNITNEISLVIAYKQLERHALQTEKLASLGTLAAGLAHEIRNPLSSIQIFAQLLPKKYNDEEFRNEFGPIVVRDVQRITNLIENVLSLSKARPPEMASNDINALIEETLALLNSEIKKNKIQIIKTYGQVSPVKGNKEELKQVFLNIILNGIQAMPNGGTLKIESSFISSLSEAEEKQYYARVKIQDTGAGIEEHALKKMFDPFFTTKPQGTGLGLALAHRIIEQHNGFIGVSSQAGKGVVFWVDLPISQIG